MKPIRCAFVLVACLFLGAGCVGTPYRWDSAREIEVGMTKDEVREIMGKPYVISMAGDNEFWTWAYGTGLGSGGSFRIVLVDGVVTEVPTISDSM